MNKRSGWAWFLAAWPLAGLCILVSSRWLVESARPEAASTHLSQAIGCLGAACLLSLGPISPRFRTEKRAAALPSLDWRLGFAAAAVLSGPAVVAILSDRHVNGENATLTFGLTPVVVAVASAAFGEAMGDELVSRLWPGLAATAGLLLLLPQPSLSDWSLDLALAAMPLVAGISAAWAGARLVTTRRTGGRTPRLPWTVPALGLAGLAFGALAARDHARGLYFTFSSLAAVLDGLTACFTLAALGQLGAVRWSAQFLLIPLLTLLEGVAFLRPMLDIRSWSAFALLAISSAYLLVTGGSETGRVQPEPTGSQA